MTVTFFNQPWLERRYRPGTRLLLTGKLAPPPRRGLNVSDHAETGDQEVEARPGSVVYVPSNVVHSGKATGDADVVFFTCKDASHSLHGIKSA